MQGKEEDEESVGCATEAEPEGDDATEVDATTECGEETVLGTLTMGSDRESIAAQTMKVQPPGQPAWEGRWISCGDNSRNHEGDQLEES